MDKHKTIIMLGPSPAEKGGMGSVETLILNIPSREFTIKHITTWNGQVSRFTKLSTAIVFIKAFLAFLWKLLKGEVDLVHIHIAERGSVIRKSVIALVCMVTGKPFILHAHGCEFHQFYDELPQGIQQMITAIFRRSAYLIALSESWRNYYVETCHLAPEQVVVLNNPVALPEQWQKTEPLGKLKFVFLGKINKRKGIFDLLNAFANLEPSYRNQVELVLAGTGEVEQVQNLATQLGIQDQIVFPGWINQQQRDQLLAESDVMLLPSYNEGLPMAILEAMSWGLPVITTPVGGIPEVIENGKTGLLITPGHIQELTAAMQSLIENPSFRLSLGFAARKRVEPLSIEHYSDALFSLYHSIFQQKENHCDPQKDRESDGLHKQTL
ncbi:glycosyltransferase family 4 protein [Planktothrix agardhii]|uniref:glycosyltransferase family 4 protein n=1 Tax=Planktothrix agardhii TaxID=1160 RepID=UPI000686CFE3|nr:glycosyltransferase family 4 protein [Planktothrix agardhii]CAD0227935.1 Glycosyl transferase, group 1 [Planktothrix agardhii]CAD5978354.1 N-acetyl-alpha-D-glucosaminyl L-malate synthase [Planktothrix agardhii]